jgi:hypothetical protein
LRLPVALCLFNRRFDFARNAIEKRSMARAVAGAVQGKPGGADGA